MLPLQRNEHDEQVAVVMWALLKESVWPELWLLYAIPNGAKLVHRVNKQGVRYSPEAEKLKAEGLKPGVPDLCLPVARGTYHGLYIEMKRPGGRVSDDQNQWLRRLVEEGYCARVAFGADKAIEVLEWYLGQNAEGA
jgi:hypothetical protein